MGKKNKRAIKNKRQNEKIKKLDNEIYSKKLIELEDVIYTYSEKELLEYFLKEFIYGQKKEHYKKSVATLYNLDIECLEFAISRFAHIENIRDVSKYYPAFVPLLAVYLTMAFNVNASKILAFFGTAISLILIIRIIIKEKRARSVAVSMLKTFEQVKARKEKDEK
ncbi:hypothetical protein [Bacillus sp. FSL K6-0923]|uniref:hypothetical protein n=1 Tax=Bacillus sp. FSL K6-0923 TaxID=2921454 RepID=UPI00315A1267